MTFRWGVKDDFTLRHLYVRHNNNNVTDERLLGLVGEWCEPQPPRLWGTRLLHLQIICTVGENVNLNMHKNEM